MKKFFSVVGIFFACIEIGCSPSDDKVPMTNQDVISYVAKLTEGVIGTNSNIIINQILSNGNAAERISGMKFFSDSLLKLNISSLSYADQRNVINEANDCIYKITSHLGYGGLSVADAFKIRIRWLKWQEEQIERLRPTKRIDKSMLTSKVMQTYNQWRTCYESLIYSHEMFIRMMESWSAELELENAPSSIKEEVTRKMEAFLGRKIRTREEAFAAKGELTDSEEMKAVRRGELAPEDVWNAFMRIKNSK